MTPLRPARRTDNEAWKYVLKHDKSVRKYAAMLFNMRRRNGGRSLTLDDACQHARLAAFRAAQLFDEQRGCSFMTLAAYWIRARLRTLFDRRGYPGANKRQPEELNLEEIRNRPSSMSRKSSDPSPKWLRDLLGDSMIAPGCAVDEVINRERVEKLQAVLESLPVRCRSIIVGRFLEDRSLDEIGRDLGLCRERVRKIEEKSLERLRVGIEALEAGRQPPKYPTFHHGRRSARMTPCRGRTSSSFSASA